MKYTISKLVVVGLLAIMPGLGMAQKNVPFDKKVFPKDQRDAFKEAYDHLKNGNDFIENDVPNYRMALEEYLKAQHFNSNNAALNYKIGLCYLATVQKTNAIPYFEKALTLEAEVNKDAHYFLGQAYHMNNELDKAIASFKKFKKILTPFELSEYGKAIEKEITECETARELMDKPLRVFIDNLGDEVNSSAPEYSPVINFDEDVIYFTSRRSDCVGGRKDESDDLFFEDAYMSKKEAGRWIRPVNMGSPLNSKSHDALVGISPDGKFALMFRGADNGGDILISQLSDEGEWEKPKALPKQINTEFNESSACFSPDMKTLFFVSDRPNGYGGGDIYMCEVTRHPRNRKLQYGEPMNMGAVINSPYDEHGLFMPADGRTLYFSSRGHKTMGGYDVFKSQLVDGRWSEPENIGYPVNTTDDDVFISVSRDGRRGYYATADKDGYGELDLHMITFLGPEKPMVNALVSEPLAWNGGDIADLFMAAPAEIKANEMVMLKGRITDAFTGEPASVRVEIIDNATGRLIAGFESSAQTGEYMVSLTSGKTYGVAVKAKDYLFYSENMDVPPCTAYQEFSRDIELKKVAVGTKIVLKNIFFDFNKATLRPESTAELNRLLKMLNDVPNLHIEIGGHTDNVGAAAYNQKLSESRARSVTEFLVANGITASRLTYKGYGFSQPVAGNDTEAGRQQNRRTEFKVMSR